MANVIEEIDAIQKEMNKNPEYRKKQLETQYVLLKDRVQHLIKERVVLQKEIEKLLEKTEKEGLEGLADDVYTLGLMLDFN